tara:strand:+ start:1419 stop:1826 length:408 start_codon:yes stop_codon:yes gene_type:complete
MHKLKLICFGIVVLFSSCFCNQVNPVFDSPDLPRHLSTMNINESMTVSKFIDMISYYDELPFLVAPGIGKIVLDDIQYSRKSLSYEELIDDMIELAKGYGVIIVKMDKLKTPCYSVTLNPIFYPGDREQIKHLLY